jgi:signal transduction histidine kinase
MILTIAYVVLSGSYIVLSGRLAAHVARSVEQLERIEILKGLVFIGLSGALFFFLTWLLMSRMELQRQRRAEQRDAMLQADRSALAGRFAGSVAHDINNVLNVANARLYSRIRESSDPEKVEVDVANVKWILDELAALSKQLLALGTERKARRFADYRLDRLISDSLSLASSHPTLRGTRVTSLVDDGLEARVDRNRIGALLLNLLLNAAEATGGTGRIHVVLRGEGQGWVLEVHDDGPGVQEAERERIFDPFRTSKPEGSGLGLLTVRSVAEDHCGRVEVTDSAELGGACFRVVVPGREA